MKILLLSLFVVFSLLGCSKIGKTPYVDAKNWVGLANYDVESGAKMRTKEDLEKLGAVMKSSQEEYVSAYKTHEKIFCNPQNAYKEGILGKARNSVCITDTPNGRAFEENWKIGLEAGDFN